VSPTLLFSASRARELHTGLLAQNERLPDRGGVDKPDLIGHQLTTLPFPAPADDDPAEQLQVRADLLDHLPGAADEDRQFAAAGAIDRSG